MLALPCTKLAVAAAEQLAADNSAGPTVRQLPLAASCKIRRLLHSLQTTSPVAAALGAASAQDAATGVSLQKTAAVAVTKAAASSAHLSVDLSVLFDIRYLEPGHSRCALLPSR